MQSCYLFLVLAVAAVSSEVIDINEAIDYSLTKVNEYLREHRYTSVHIPEGSFDSHVSFSESDVVGLDSLKRTDNCTLEVVDKNATLDYHYGFGLYQQTFKLLKVNGQEMSGGFRIRDNSVHLHFTLHNFGDRTRCFVTLHDLSNERLANVDFYSSRPEYDGIDVEDYFGKVLTPALNNKIDKKWVEKALQSYLCKQQHLEVSEHMPFIHMSILEQLGVPSQLSM